MLINEEVVLATPVVSGSCEGGIPGHAVGVRQGTFPSWAPGSRFGTDPPVPGRDQHKGRPRDMAEEVSRTAQSPHHPGRPQSCGARFRHHLGSMLKGLGSIPEHTNSLFYFFPSNHSNEAIHIYFAPRPNADSSQGCLLRPVIPPHPKGKPGALHEGAGVAPAAPAQNQGHIAPLLLFTDQLSSPRRCLLLYTEGLVLKTRLGLRLPDHPSNPGSAHRVVAHREMHELRRRQICPHPYRQQRAFSISSCLYFLFLLAPRPPHLPPRPRSYLRPVSSPRLPRRKMAAPAQRRLAAPSPAAPAAPLPPERLRGLRSGTSPALRPSPWPRYSAGPGCRCWVVGAGQNATEQSVNP